MKRKLVLRGYQVPAAKFALDNDMVVLGMAPNGGKTEVSIDVLVNFLKLYPNAKVLILTHSTNVLKDNYTTRLDNLEIDFSFSTNFDAKCQIHICLPHSEHLIKDHYDFLIVDEAHENYLADRVQRIVKKIKPKKQLLLTGTPARFIKEGWGDNGSKRIFTLAANSIPVEYFAKLQVELIASKYNWSKSFNSDLELLKTARFDIDETEETLETILLKLIDRLKKGLSPEEFNNPNILTKLKSWAFTYKKLGKTLIICKTIKQANDVYNVLLKHNVNAMVSNSKTDIDSLEVEKFKNNEFDVLVVVDRVRLGYSDEKLYNIIDMSGTHNPNVIYQIFSRVLRGTPDMQKYYLKVTTQEYGMMDFTHACVSAALMLTDERYLSTFDGGNFKNIKVPIIKKKLIGGSNKIKTKKTRNNFVFPEFTNDVIDMFKNIIHNLDEPVSIYKMTSIGDVRAALTGKIVWTEESILDTIYV